MKEVYAWLMRVLRIAGSLAFTVYITLSFWGAELAETWKALRHVTVADISPAAITGVVIAAAIYLLGRLPGWPHKNVYDVVIPVIARFIKPVYRERLELIHGALTEPVDEEDDYDDDESVDMVVYT